MAVAPSLAEQVRDAVLDEIATGRWPAGSRVIQEQLAQRLGVSRQPVQQALLLLREQGVLREAPGRGLEVAPLVADEIEQVYELRAVIEGRTRPPTEAENAAHLAAGGAWLVVWQWRDGVPVAEIAWGKHVCGDDRPKDARWIALDRERRPCPWPEVAR